MQSSTQPQVFPLDDPFYPARDGEPLSDNPLQFRWIMTIQGGLDALFLDAPEVLVVGNNLWYPVEGQNTIRTAPDVMVIFGRPKGDRGSYIQHREGGIPVQVVFEILSPGNRAGEMQRKLEFYDRYGAEEYYILDPDFGRHKGYLRVGHALTPITDLFGWTSPRLGVRFEVAATLKPELRIVTPDGRLLEHYTDVVRQRDQADRLAEEERERAREAVTRATQERERAREANRQATQERERAQEAVTRAAQERERAHEAMIQAAQERERAHEANRRATEESTRAQEATARAERLLAQLRALGLEPEA